MKTLSVVHDCTSATLAHRPSLLAGLIAALKRELEVRRALREVRSLDEAMLHDIGISPGSLEDAVRCGRR